MKIYILRAFINNTIEDSINNVWQVQVNPQTISTIFSDQMGVAVSIVQYPFIEYLVDVNITNQNDKQDLIFSNSQQSWINASKNEFSNSHIF